MNGQSGFSANQLIDPNALPDWMKAQAAGAPQAAGMQPAAANGQVGWSASNLIDPSALPGWVQGMQGMQGAQGNGAGMNGPAYPQAGDAGDAPRERTGRVAAPRGNPDASMNSSRHRAAGYDQAEQDFGASRAGTAQRGSVSRKYPSARPLDEHEKPEWLREDGPDGYPDGYGDRGGRPASVAGRQERNGRNSTGYDGGYDGYDGQDAYGQNGYGQNGQRRPRGQTGQSWAAPDDYEASPWSRPRPTRQQAKPGAKKRRGGFFGFLRRGW